MPDCDIAVFERDFGISRKLVVENGIHEYHKVARECAVDSECPGVLEGV
jgi:hypothetical protein